jgi:hypothetical protein
MKSAYISDVVSNESIMDDEGCVSVRCRGISVTKTLKITLVQA